jgi:hypothetical protein
MPDVVRSVMHGLDLGESRNADNEQAKQRSEPKLNQARGLRDRCRKRE